MARVNDVTIRLAADVTKLKTGFSSAGQSVKQLSAQVQGLTKGQIKLTSAGRFYDTQRKQFISTAKAEKAISKGLQQEYTRTQTAVTAVANATRAAVEAEVQKVNSSKSLAQISKETIASFSASGNAVQHLTARLVALTKGEYLLSASGKILNATTKQEVTLKEAASAATARLSMEQSKLRAAYGKATAGMDAAQKRLLDTQMAMTGLSSITGSASFAAISMGQIFQDMGQFGMGAAQGVRAITNNVQQTVQSLVMLSAMTAKGESVFKAFTTALKGPVGFLVAFSAVTGLIELFSNRAQKAQKEAKDLSNAFIDLAEVIPTRNVRSFLITQMQLEKEAASLRTRISDLAKETEMIGLNYGVITRQTKEAKEESEKLKLELEGITEALDDIVKSGTEYTDWLLSIKGLQALASKTLQDFQTQIADLEAQVAMSGEFGQFEERVESLQNVIASGLGFEFKDPDEAIAEFEKRYAEFSGRLGEIGSEISKSKFAKLFKDGETEEFFSEEYKEFITERVDRTINNMERLNEAANRFGEGAAPRGLQSKVAQRVEEIQRSSTVVGRMQGAQGIQPEELRQLSPEAQAEVDAIGQQIEDQNRQGTDSWMAHWSRRTEATIQSAQIMQQAIGSIGSTFMQLAQTGDKSNKRLFEIGKKLAIAQALISTYVGFTKALEQGGVLGIATGASVLAAGMAKVAAIKATKMGGGGSGGGSAARPNFTMPNPLTSPASFSSQGMFPATSNAPSFSGRFVASGRDLVAVVGAETDARQELGFTRNLVIGG